MTVKIPSKSDLEYHIKKCKVEKTNLRIFLTCNNSELVAFNAEYLLNFLKIGILELFGFNSMKVFTGKTEKINALIMPMNNKEQFLYTAWYKNLNGLIQECKNGEHICSVLYKKYTDW